MTFIVRSYSCRPKDPPQRAVLRKKVETGYLGEENRWTQKKRTNQWFSCSYQNQVYTIFPQKSSPRIPSGTPRIFANRELKHNNLRDPHVHACKNPWCTRRQSSRRVPCLWAP